MELNTIQQQTNWQKASSDLNANFSKVSIEVEKLKSRALKVKGYFDSAALLESSHPNPRAGDVGYVKNTASSTGYYIYDVLSDGTWNATTQAAPLPELPVDGLALAGGSAKTLQQVDDEKIGYKTGKNLFNVNSSENEISKFLNEVYGGISENTNYNVSHLVEVEPNTTYSHQGVRNYAYFSEKNYNSIISNSGGEISDTSISPSNAKYIAVTTWKEIWTTLQIEKSNSPTPFEPYSEKIDENLLKDIPDSAFSKALNRSTDIVKIDDIFIENLFNKNTITSGTYVNGYYGTLNPNVNYDSSDFISVKKNQQLQKKNTLQHWAFYDVNKIFISGGETGEVQNVNKLTAPADGYFRFSMLAGLANTEYLLTTHDSISPIPAFGDKVIRNSILSKDEIEIILPDEIIVAVGRTIEIYNEQIAICGNINNYHFRWICEIGRGLKRKYSVTGINTAQKTLTLEVYSNAGGLLVTKTTTIKVVNILSAAKKVLPLGDSITNNKPWLSELRTLSAGRITLVGTRGAGSEKHEGRSGWAASQYLAGTAYSYENEGVHPFWNASKNRFDWNYYKTSTGVNPDAVMINLGTNQLNNYEQAAAQLKQIVDYIRQDDANITICIALVHHWGNQDALGGQTSVDGFQALPGYFDLNIRTKVLSLNKKYLEIFEGYANLHFVPLYATMDREHNYGLVDTPVNPRQTLTEKMPVDSVHPQDSGYFQFADAMIGVLSK